MHAATTSYVKYDVPTSSETTSRLVQLLVVGSLFSRQIYCVCVIGRSMTLVCCEDDAKK